jgi:hypothetical protein
MTEATLSDSSIRVGGVWRGEVYRVKDHFTRQFAAFQSILETIKTTGLPRISGHTWWRNKEKTGIWLHLK